MLDARLGKELGLSYVDGKLRMENRSITIEIYATYEDWIEELADSLDLEMRVEEWFKPPLYREGIEVAVLEVGPEIYKAMIGKLRKRVQLWNTFPSPLQRVLWRNGLRPSVCDDEIPEPRYARLGFRGWAGRPNISSWRYVKRVEVDLNGEIVEVSPDEVGELIESHSPHVIILEGREWRRLALSIPEVRSHLEKGVMVDSLPLDITLRGLMEWSFISYAPLRLASRHSIGEVLTSVEAFKAMERRYLVPEVAVRVERWRKVSDLLRADRGGLILTPKPGLYWDVAQLDFDSFFPSIISQENISPETVNDASCSDWVEVPGVGHRICLDRRGLVAESVGELVRRKRLYKELGDEERLKAIKWVLVACFGYLGYRNARFGSIESYESVTAMARHLMTKAIEIASRRGEVLHSLVDSLFVRTSDPESLAEEIERELGYKIRVQAVYRWLVFPKSEIGLGVPSRYFGRLSGGGMKVKGILRRDMPPFIRSLIEEAMGILEQASDSESLVSALSEVDSLFNEAVSRLRRGDVSEELLVIERRVGSPSREVRHWKAASLVGISEGRIRYVESRYPYPVEMGRNGYDLERYMDMVRRAQRPFRFMLEEIKGFRSVTKLAG